MGLVAKAFQDIITFSRASSGTYVNSNGYITNSSVLNYLTYSNQPENAAWTKSNSFVQQNLLTYSEDFTNAAWSKINSSATANATLAPDGTLTADSIIADATPAVQHRTDETPVSSAGLQTFSVYLKYFGYQWASLRIGGVGATFDIQNGVVGTTSTATSRSIQSIGNGWYRCIVHVAAALANDVCRINIENADLIATNFAGTGTTGLYVWGAQLVQGSVPGDYRATTSAALPCLYADYNGALRARKLCENSGAAATHTVNQIANSAVGATVTFSYYLKQGERVWALLYTSAGQGKSFSLATGTLGGDFIAAPAGSFITPLGNGWYRCSITVVAIASTTTCFAYTADADTSGFYAGNGSSGIYIADAQLNDGSSALAYYDTTAFAYNAPRFDYDPVTLAAKGLLVEESRANLLLQSNDFQTSWTPTNITRTLNSTLSPSGNVDGVKIAATAAVSTILYQAQIVSATSATYSIYVKQGTGATTANSFLLRNSTTSTNLVGGTINYSTGVWTYTTGSTGVVVSDAGNGWWRLQISATSGITSGNIVVVYVGFVGSPATTGDHLYAYGAQLEAGAFATSYIPTAASQVTRAADVASVNTLSPWFNSVTGTLYFEGITTSPVDTNVRNAVTINDGTISNAHRIFSYSGKIGASTIISGTNVSDLQPLTYTSGATFKSAYAFAVNDFAMTANGLAPFTDTLGALPPNLSTLSIGGPGIYWGFWVRRITYYPRRLTNAELQTLTTL